MWQAEVKINPICENPICHAVLVTSRDFWGPPRVPRVARNSSFGNNVWPLIAHLAICSFGRPPPRVPGGQELLIWQPRVAMNCSFGNLLFWQPWPHSHCCSRGHTAIAHLAICSFGSRGHQLLIWQSALSAALATHCSFGILQS